MFLVRKSDKKKFSTVPYRWANRFLYYGEKPTLEPGFHPPFPFSHYPDLSKIIFPLLHHGVCAIGGDNERRRQCPAIG